MADGPAVRFIENVDPAAVRRRGGRASIRPPRSWWWPRRPSPPRRRWPTPRPRARWIERKLGEGAVARHLVAATATAARRRALGPARSATCSPSPSGSAGASRSGPRWACRWPSPSACPPSSACSPGAHAADLAFRSDPLERNVAALMALLRRVEPQRARLRQPRGAAVRLAPRRPAGLRAAARDGVQRQARRPRRDAGRLRDRARRCWAPTGTPGQHAFHQWLHQGTDPVSCDFIVVARPMGTDADRARAPARARAARNPRR